MQTGPSDSKIAINLMNLSGPRGELLRGNLPDLLADPTGFLTRCARDYGDLVPLRFGPKRALLLSHPALVDDVLVRSRSAFVKPFAIRTDGFEPVEDRGGRGDVWGRAELGRGAFHRDRIEGYGDVMADIIQREIETWNPDDGRDLDVDLNRLAFMIVTRTLFGADGAGHAEAVAAALPQARDEFFNRAKTLFLIPQGFPTPGNRRLHRALRALEQVMDHVLANGVERSDGTGGLLSTLTAGSYDSTRVRDEALTFLLAGYETVATTLAWTWRLLADHPEIEAALTAEVDDALGGRPPMAADVKHLPLIAHVVNEALRLYPPLWIIVRAAVVDVRVSGYAIEAGTLVLMSPWVVQRDGRFFADPDRFRPERWDDGLEKRLPRHAYFPFGGGQRGCIGSGFAMLEAVLILAAVTQRFRIAPTSDHPLRPQASLTLQPTRGARMARYERRAAPAGRGARHG